jgi:hypothetical protein
MEREKSEKEGRKKKLRFVFALQCYLLLRNPSEKSSVNFPPLSISNTSIRSMCRRNSIISVPASWQMRPQNATNKQKNVGKLKGATKIQN